MRRESRDHTATPFADDEASVPSDVLVPAWLSTPIFARYGQDVSVTTESRHICISVARSAADVYDYAVNPAYLPEWAAGLGGSIAHVDGKWIADSPMGQVVVSFADRNTYGVLDHYVTLPSGETVHNPMRVLADGTGCEVVFTLRRRPGTSDEEFSADADAVTADLARLKRLLERH